VRRPLHEGPQGPQDRDASGAEQLGEAGHRCQHDGDHRRHRLRGQHDYTTSQKIEHAQSGSKQSFLPSLHSPQAKVLVPSRQYHQCL
jgi:hypothetical protein